MIKKVIPIDSPLVSICCLTFNHKPYIRECLDDFLSQKTSFAFEIVIGEDFSTDGTREIVFEYAEKYPEIIRVITADYNVGMRANIERCISACRGEYIAFCEGDDYWNDPIKLQMQVDFMESNPEYGMCYTKCIYYYNSEQKFEKKPWGGEGTLFSDFMKRNYVPTLTTLINKDKLFQYHKEIQPENKNWEMGDYPMWLWFAYNSKIKFIDIVTGVYRVLDNSASHSTDVEKKIQFVNSGLDIKKFFNDKYNFGKTEKYYKKRALRNKLRQYAIYNQKQNFFKQWFSSVKSDLSNLFVLKNYTDIRLFFCPKLRKSKK